MLVLLNKTIVNLDNVESMERYYTTLKTPGQPERKDKPRISITFVSGSEASVNFESAQQMDEAFAELFGIPHTP